MNIQEHKAKAWEIAWARCPTCQLEALGGWDAFNKPHTCGGDFGDWQDAQFVAIKEMLEGRCAAHGFLRLGGTESQLEEAQRAGNLPHTCHGDIKLVQEALLAVLDGIRNRMVHNNNVHLLTEDLAVYFRALRAEIMALTEEG